MMVGATGCGAVGDGVTAIGAGVPVGSCVEVGMGVASGGALTQPEMINEETIAINAKT